MFVHFVEVVATLSFRIKYRNLELPLKMRGPPIRRKHENVKLRKFKQTGKINQC